jgi:integrase
MRAGRSKRFLAPLLKRFGDTPLSGIVQAEVDAAAIALYPRASAPTRNRQVYSPVSAILRHCGVQRPIRRPKGSASAPRPHWLKPEQAFALLDAAAVIDQRFGALLSFLLYRGPRLSEALRLEWPDVDLARSTALLRQTKNGEPMTLHLPPQVIAALANLASDSARCGSPVRLSPQFSGSRNAGASIRSSLLRRKSPAFRSPRAAPSTSCVTPTRLGGASIRAPTPRLSFKPASGSPATRRRSMSIST